MGALNGGQGLRLAWLRMLRPLEEPLPADGDARRRRFEAPDLCAPSCTKKRSAPLGHGVDLPDGLSIGHVHIAADAAHPLPDFRGSRASRVAMRTLVKTVSTRRSGASSDPPVGPAKRRFINRQHKVPGTGPLCAVVQHPGSLTDRAWWHATHRYRTGLQAPGPAPPPPT